MMYLMRREIKRKSAISSCTQSYKIFENFHQEILDESSIFKQKFFIEIFGRTFASIFLVRAKPKNAIPSN